jgi:hypothetical protein
VGADTERMLGIPNFLLVALLFFGIISVGLIVYHEQQAAEVAIEAKGDASRKDIHADRGHPILDSAKPKIVPLQKRPPGGSKAAQLAKGGAVAATAKKDPKVHSEIEVAEGVFKGKDSEGNALNDDAKDNRTDAHPVAEWHEEEKERRGELICNGKPIDSEVIYWKIVPGDDTYESPITPHHGYFVDRNFLVVWY